MGKVNKKTITLLIITIILVMLIPSNVKAAGSFSINKTSASLKNGDSTTITVTANQCAGKFNISSSNTSVATVSPSSVFLDNSTATITITSKGVGNATINIISADVTDTDLNDVTGTKTCSITVTNPTPEQKPDTTPNPTPTPTPEPTKSSNANLKNLGIKPNDFSGFKAATTEYNVTVPNDVEKIELYAVAQDANAKVSGIGTKTLNEGKNTFSVVVTAEDGKTKKTYTLNITRKGVEKTDEEIDPEDIFGLSSLKIEGMKINPEFKTDIYQYKINITDESVTNLNVEAIATEINAKVEITGNEEIKEGENIVTIVVTDGTGKKTATYQIIVNKEAEKEELIATTISSDPSRNNKNNSNLLKYIIVVVAVLAIAAIIIIAIKKSKKQPSVFDSDDISFTGMNNDERSSNNKTEENISGGYDEVFEDGEDEFPPKKTRGKRFK